jgi:hypothetical protein
MARTIWKYTLNLGTLPQEVSIPVGSELLSVGEQEGVLVLWAMVDPGRRDDTEIRTISVVATDYDVPNGILRFIGTVQKESGTVWHVFEG